VKTDLPPASPSRSGVSPAAGRAPLPTTIAGSKDGSSSPIRKDSAKSSAAGDEGSYAESKSPSNRPRSMSYKEKEVSGSCVKTFV
jgi:hypothetical protein